MLTAVIYASHFLLYLSLFTCFSCFIWRAHTRTHAAHIHKDLFFLSLKYTLSFFFLSLSLALSFSHAHILFPLLFRCVLTSSSYWTRVHIQNLKVCGVERELVFSVWLYRYISVCKYPRLYRFFSLVVCTQLPLVNTCSELCHCWGFGSGEVSMYNSDVCPVGLMVSMVMFVSANINNET